MQSLQVKIDSDLSARQAEKKQLNELQAKIGKYSSKSEELLSALTGAKNNNKTQAADLARAVQEKHAALERVRTFDEREAELVRQLQFMDDVRRKLHNRVMQLTGNIRVFVRVRPMLSFEEQVRASRRGANGEERSDDAACEFLLYIIDTSSLAVRCARRAADSNVMSYSLLRSSLLLSHRRR